MTKEERIYKLKNGSETAIWAANEIERLQFEANKLRGLALWSLYHHQGANSNIGQPIRKALGIGKLAKMTHEQIKAARIAGGERFLVVKHND